MADERSLRQRVARTRREPPPFRAVTVERVERRSPRLVRITFGGPALDGLDIDQPAASVRLLLPSPGSGDLVVPAWNGNEFLLADGTRPVIRTFTPRRFDPQGPDGPQLDIEIVVHGDGAASEWAAAASPGDPAAVSGPGRGYAVDDQAEAFLLAGDETAVPAISQLLEVLPTTAAAHVHIELADPAAEVPLPEHPGAAVEWHQLPAGEPPGAALLRAVQEAEIPEGTRVWVAGEAAAVQRIRRNLFEERGLSRRQATVRGYWKHGRAAGADGDDGGDGDDG